MPTFLITHLKRDGTNIKQWKLQLSAFADSKAYGKWLTESNRPTCTIVQQKDAEGKLIPYTKEEQITLDAHEIAYNE